MVVTIRAAERADSDGITDVQIAAWRAGYSHVFPESVLYAEDFDRSRRRYWASWRFSPGHRLAVAVRDVDGSVVGFSSYGPERERARGFTGRAELYAFYVHPDDWGTGTATALMEHTEHRLRAEGFETAVLWVLEDNPRGRAFYTKHGWAATGLSARYDEYDGVDVLEVEYRKEWR